MQQATFARSPACITHSVKRHIHTSVNPQTSQVIVDMENANKDRKILVIGPKHKSYNLKKAWFVFGVYDESGRVRRILVAEAKSQDGVHVMESIVSPDGIVSSTCSLMFVSSSEPQIRSTLVETVNMVDFIVDMVDSDKWFNPVLVSMLQKYTSRVNNASSEIRMGRLAEFDKMKKAKKMLDRERELEKKLEQDENQKDPTECSDSMKFDQLDASLRGLGFAKGDVRKFVDSVRTRNDPVKDLLIEGIDKLNRGTP
jgi:hypothetical protein